MLAALGWAVVHSLWQCTFIAGLTAMVLGLLREPRARARYAIAYTSLSLMALAAVATAFAGTTGVGSRVRQQIVYAIDDPIAASLPAVISGAAIIVPAAGVLWLAGVAVSSLRVALEWRRVRALRRGGVRDASDTIRATVSDLRTQMSVQIGVDIGCSTGAAVPMVLGWRRPLILLPAGAAAALTSDQLRTILVHELAHVRRGDYLANLVQTAFDTLLFHHPAARWVSRQVRTEREYCCDDVAVAGEQEIGTYAHALAALEDARGEYRLAVAAASGTLLDRIQRIAGHKRPTLTPARGVMALVIASVVAGAILAIAMVVPPSLPAGAQLRRRVPPPNGVVLPPSSERLPRKQTR